MLGLLLARFAGARAALHHAAAHRYHCAGGCCMLDSRLAQSWRLWRHSDSRRPRSTASHAERPRGCCVALSGWGWAIMGRRRAHRAWKPRRRKVSPGPGGHDELAGNIQLPCALFVETLRSTGLQLNHLPALLLLLLAQQEGNQAQQAQPNSPARRPP